MSLLQVYNNWRDVIFTIRGYDLLLPKKQKIFRHYDYTTGQTSYCYRTNEQLVGTAAKPVLIKKHYRLGTRSLTP